MKLNVNLITFIFFSAIFCGSAMADDTYFDSELRVKVSQSGFAGETGTSYVVDALGNWQMVDFIGDNSSGKELSGAFSAEDVAELHELLEAVLASQTANAEVDINARTIEVEYGTFKGKIILPAEGAELESIADNENTEKLADWLSQKLKQ